MLDLEPEFWELSNFAEKNSRNMTYKLGNDYKPKKFKFLRNSCKFCSHSLKPTYTNEGQRALERGGRKRGKKRGEREVEMWNLFMIFILDHCKMDESAW